jgi:hypothetical protein
LLSLQLFLNIMFTQFFKLLSTYLISYQLLFGKISFELEAFILGTLGLWLSCAAELLY